MIPGIVIYQVLGVHHVILCSWDGFSATNLRSLPKTEEGKNGECKTLAYSFSLQLQLLNVWGFCTDLGWSHMFVKAGAKDKGDKTHNPGEITDFVQNLLAQMVMTGWSLTH